MLQSSGQAHQDEENHPCEVPGERHIRVHTYPDLTLTSVDSDLGVAAQEDTQGLLSRMAGSKIVLEIVRR